MPRFVFLARFGPEVRLYLQSGLADALVRRGHSVSFVTLRPHADVWGDTSFKRLPWPSVDREPPWIRRLRHRARRIDHWLRMGRPGVATYRHNLDAPDALVARPAQYRIPRFQRALWTRLERWLNGVRFGLGDWPDCLRDFDHVVASAHSDYAFMAALRAAKLMQLDTTLLIAGWKDMTVNSHFGVVPGRILVWNERMEDTVRAAVGLPGVRIAAVGSMHAAALVRPSEPIGRSAFCRSVGLEPHRPFVLYTTAAQEAVDKEPELLGSLLRKSAVLHPDLQWLVRLNPMVGRAAGAFLDSISGIPGVVVQVPQWEWDREAEWCVGHTRDLEVYRASIVHALCNVSIPSTVTLECALFGCPVINIAFDAPGVESRRSCLRRWEAEFYREVKESGFAVVAYNEGDLLARVGAIMRSPRDPEQMAIGQALARGLLALDCDPVETVVREIG